LSIKSKLSRFKASLVISNSNSVSNSVSIKDNKEEEKKEDKEYIIFYRLFKDSILLSFILLNITSLTSIILLSYMFYSL
jgi:hypothetical protein